MSANQYYGSNDPNQQQYPPPNQQQYGGHPQHQQYAPPSGPPPGQGQGAAHGYYSQQPSHPQQGAPEGFHPPRRSDTEAALPTGAARSEQLETLQNYEANARQTEDDMNQATLCKEFPQIDSSLIAALYGDSKSLSATREMLHELASSSQQ